MSEAHRKVPSPTISLIIPAYNLQDYIDICLLSVSNQTFADFEAIVVDDGSTDHTLDIIRRYAQGDARITVISTPNRGVARARQTGLQNASGKYICFVDGDDFLEPQMLEYMVGAFADADFDIVCCGYLRVCQSYQSTSGSVKGGTMQGPEFLEALLSNHIWGGVWGKLYRRELFDHQLNHYPIRLWEDVMINIQIACNQPKVHYIEYIGYNYVQRGGSANRSGIDFNYCLVYCDAVATELVLHQPELNGKLEFYILLNNFRTYMIYLGKSSCPWVGNHPFVVKLRAQVKSHRKQLRPFYPTIRIWMLRLDRYQWMYPVLVFVKSLLRWRNSFKRRWSNYS